MRQDEVKKRRTKSPEQALAALMRLCARAEKSSGDARRLMRGWGLSEHDAERVLRQLVQQRFIDDSRYACAFVREKVNLGGWWAYKIRAALSRKGIDRATADAALAEISPAQSAERLAQQLSRKVRTVRAATPYELKTKLIRYGLSLGYDFEAVREAAGAIVKTTDEECDIF
ncbi:MAG: RecX family transcriptional regulator [Alistipes sp.]|nr:RecX family transcriptional regulator [Alistipes sp.]